MFLKFVFTKIMCCSFLPCYRRWIPPKENVTGDPMGIFFFHYELSTVRKKSFYFDRKSNFVPFSKMANRFCGVMIGVLDSRAESVGSNPGRVKAEL